MKVTPLDIRRKEFKRSMRGYSDEEVDVFLDDVADEFERIFQENMELSDRVQRLEEQIAGHVQMRDALEKTLISAQMQSDEMKANARKEGELILQEAELKAREIVNESYSETQRVQQALIQLKHLEEDFRFKFRSLLEGHLKLLNDATLSTAAAEPRVPAAEAVGEEAVEAGPIEDEVPTEETEAGPAVEASRVALASVVAATEEAEAGPVDDGAVHVASAAAGIEEATGETLPTATSEESTAEIAAGEILAAEPPAAGAEPAEIPDETEEPARGFFFGRQPDDIDDTFIPPEGTQEKPRDFEW